VKFAKDIPLSPFKKRIRNLIIGSDVYIESYGEFKQVMLSGQFALIGILFCSGYAAIAFFLGTYESLPVYATTIFFLGLSIFIHRQGDHCLANYFLLPTINITVYLFAASESSHSGIFIFFIVNAIGAFAVFNYKQRLLSILFAVSTYVLFALAYFVDFTLLPHRDYSDEMMLFKLVLNFTVALPCATMGVYLLISLNHYNALQLVHSNEQLMKTNSELDRFVYSTSHDLRAPLTSVMGLIDIANRSNSEQEIKKYLVMMKDRVHSLDKFIRDITDYSRNNRQEISRERISLHALATEVWESLKFSPEAENIEFTIDVAQEGMIESDRNRLKMIVGNLISNAIRYHDPRKNNKYIRLQYLVNGRVSYLKVEDNGQGIAPEFHTRIFDMFFRGNESSKGSGLGLYIVKEALVKLSGSIRLESSPGVGSTFIVKLPQK
jgi:signal transduction histidine kinase